MKNILVVNAAIFITVAFAHALRLAYQAPFTIGDIILPLWVSWIGVALGLLMAWLNWKTLPQRGKRAILKFLLTLIVIDATALFYSWSAHLAYWGFSGNIFLWFMFMDGAIIASLWYLLQKSKGAEEK